MKKYINTRQLGFLIFILLTIFLIRFFRGEDESDSNQQVKINSSLNESFRSNPLSLTPLAECQKSCLGIADSSLQLVIKYANLDPEKDTQNIEGRSMDGKMFSFQLIKQQDKNVIMKLYDVPQNCDCLE